MSKLLGYFSAQKLTSSRSRRSDGLSAGKSLGKLKASPSRKRLDAELVKQTTQPPAKQIFARPVAGAIQIQIPVRQSLRVATARSASFCEQQQQQQQKAPRSPCPSPAPPTRPSSRVSKRTKRRRPVEELALDESTSEDETEDEEEVISRNENLTKRKQQQQVAKAVWSAQMLSANDTSTHTRPRASTRARKVSKRYRDNSNSDNDDDDDDDDDEQASAVKEVVPHMHSGMANNFLALTTMARQDFASDPVVRGMTRRNAKLAIKLAGLPAVRADFHLDPEACASFKIQHLMKKDEVPKFRKIKKNLFNQAIPRSRRKEKVPKDEAEQCQCMASLLKHQALLRKAAAARKNGDGDDVGSGDDEDDPLKRDEEYYHCGDDCLNRLLQIECSPDTCDMKGKCRNRSFQQAKWAKLSPFKTMLKGWGLRLEEDVSAGDFLIEYVGEVINNKICAERIKSALALAKATEKQKARAATKVQAKVQRVQARLEKKKQASQKGNKRRKKGSSKRSRKGSPRKQARTVTKAKKRPVKHVCDDSDDEHDDDQVMETSSIDYYFLTVSDDVVIDARKKGGIARFINHSCNPNCEVQKWRVAGELRIGIFAERDLKAGTELTIDYQYDRVGSFKRQRCYCGEANCAKWIGGKKKEMADDDNSRGASSNGKQQKKKKFKMEGWMADEECVMCGGGGEVLCCDGKLAGQHCTRVYHLKCLGHTKMPTGGWLCPRHFCRECEDHPRASKVFCSTCSNSWCEKHADLWEAENIPGEPPEKLDPSVPDLPPHRAPRWVVCLTCQEDGPAITRRPLAEMRVDLKPPSSRRPTPNRRKAKERSSSKSQGKKATKKKAAAAAKKKKRKPPTKRKPPAARRPAHRLTSRQKAARAKRRR